MIRIDPADPRSPEALALLHAHHALMRSLYAAEDNHFLGADALAGPNVLFFLARAEARVVGMAALALRNGYAEVKSMFALPEARGTGVGRALLARLEHAARERGVPVLRLETGVGLDAAHALYRAGGFVDRGPFGDYAASPASVFMEKRL